MSRPVRLLCAGTPTTTRVFADQALLLEFTDSDARDAAARALRAADHTLRPVLGEVTILLPTTPARPRVADLRGFITELPAQPHADDTSATGREVTIPIRFDGPDLTDVAARTGQSEASLIAELTGVAFHAAFGGFAPGFTYLTGLPRHLHLPRRSTPRDIVPAGSVAIADRFAGIYPRSSPGGWHLLGTTDTVLFDPDRDPPTALAPGDLVRFHDLAGPRR